MVVTKRSIEFRHLAVISLLLQAYPVYLFMRDSAIPDVVTTETIIIKLIPISIIFVGNYLVIDALECSLIVRNPQPPLFGCSLANGAVMELLCF